MVSKTVELVKLNFFQCFPDKTQRIPPLASAFVADNPGDWMLDCHTLEHHAGGIMGVIRVV
jgi:hypothetical protein